ELVYGEIVHAQEAPIRPGVGDDCFGETPAAGEVAAVSGYATEGRGQRRVPEHLAIRRRSPTRHEHVGEAGPGAVQFAAPVPLVRDDRRQREAFFRVADRGGE